ncbi:MAG: bacterial transcriptional activator domain-containing protein, partial [Chloroflexota bacterium]
MAPLTLGLLGRTTAVDTAEHPIKFRTSRVQALLIYLTVEHALGASDHRREGLIDLFWPGLPEKSALQNLRQTIYQLKRNVPDFAPPDFNKGPIPLLLTDRQTIGLNPQFPLTADIFDFQRLQKGSVEGWASAAELYRGPFLVDFSIADAETFEEWANARRAYFHNEMMDTLNSLTIYHSNNRFYEEAARFARRQIELDNLRERGYQQLMVALTHSGRRSEALAIFDDLERLLEQELSLEPNRETKEIRESIYADDLDVTTPQEHRLRGYQLKEQIGAG